MNDLFKFIGEDGSLGYRTGQVYRLRLRRYGVKILRPTICPYSSWDKFLENWERV